MTAKSPKEVIQNITQIGALPQTLAAVLNVINDPTAGADDIAEIISKDVSLTTRVLKMVNSSHYARRRKVTKISEAVMVMGLNSIRMLTLSSSVFGMLPEKEIAEKLDVRRIWRHLIETATNARSISAEAGFKEPEEAFVAGILHDVGIILMLLHFKARYADMVSQPNVEKHELLEIEEKEFGFNHCDVGRELADTWKLPAPLAFSIGNHHALNDQTMIPEEAILNNIVSLADRLTLGPFDNYHQDVESNIMFIQKACEKLQMEMEATNRIRKESLVQSIKLAEYLELDIGDIIDILTEANEQLAELYFSLERLYLEKAERQSFPGNVLKEPAREIVR